MTHCSENSLFQTSGQATAQGGWAGAPRSSAQHTECGLAPRSHPPVGLLSGGAAFEILCSLLNLQIDQEQGRPRRAGAPPPLPCSLPFQ